MELIKITSTGQSVSTQAERSRDDEKLNVGGAEGIKLKTKLKNPRQARHPQTTKSEIRLVSKQSNYESRSSIEKKCKNYSHLRRKGFPVPDIARYSTKLGRITLHTSDVTENGQYRIWGWSDHMKPSQKQELNQMELTQKDLIKIQAQTKEWSQKATHEQITLEPYYYHIRQHKDTRKIDIVFLDLNEYSQPTYDLSTENQENVEEFLHNLLLNL